MLQDTRHEVARRAAGLLRSNSIFALQERRRSKNCTNLEAHALQLAALASSDTGSGRSLADLLAAPQRRGSRILAPDTCLRAGFYRPTCSLRASPLRGARLALPVARHSSSCAADSMMRLVSAHPSAGRDRDRAMPCHLGPAGWVVRPRRHPRCGRGSAGAPPPLCEMAPTHGRVAASNRVPGLVPPAGPGGPGGGPGRLPPLCPLSPGRRLAAGPCAPTAPTADRRDAEPHCGAAPPGGREGGPAGPGPGAGRLSLSCRSGY
jgi:hypothetical protein